MSNLVVRALQEPFQKREHQSFQESIFSIFSGISATAPKVNHHGALSLSAVYNAVDQISNDIAKLPKGVFEKKGRDRYRKPEHPADYLISKRPNKMMTEFIFHKTLTVSALLRGNGIAIIERSEATGRQTAFKFVHPDHLNDIKEKDGKLWYYIRGYKEPIAGDDVIHIPGFSFNGVTGISVFKFAAQNMGTAILAEKFAGENFQSKGLLAGFIKAKTALKAPAKLNLANAMETRLSKGGTHNIGVLDEDMDFQELKINAQEAALIDWKKVSIEDVARWFNIAPHKIKHLEKASYSNIEQQSLEHGSDSIAPWARRFEQEYDYKLFTEKERLTHYVKFNTNSLIRTDIKTKADYYAKAINFSWHVPNEIRALEDYNPLEGLDEPWRPSNMMPIIETDNPNNNGG